MCLDYDAKYTKSFRSRFYRRPKGTKIKMWRLVTNKSNQVVSIFMSVEQKAGWYKSDRKEELGQVELTEMEKDWYMVDHGIHVYINREDAKEDAHPRDVVMPVWCQLKDFVAAGDFGGVKCAVFDKVYIKKNDLKKAKADLRDRGQCVW